MNRINIGEKIISEKAEYVVLESTEYEGELYYFVNELISGIPSDNFLIVFIKNNKVNYVSEGELLDKLLLIFAKKIDKS